MTEEQARNMLWDDPAQVGRAVGFTDLTELHNEWLRAFLYGKEDQTLQAHRGSFKTTTLSLFFAIHIILFPNETILYFRKTSGDVSEIAVQTAKILATGAMRELSTALYGKPHEFISANRGGIQTTLATTTKGAAQLMGLGVGTSITGKHADIVVTDDIVNIFDRISPNERMRTKLAFMELQNIKNRGGRFINTGTPWHKDDCFTLMPNIHKYDCYHTGLMTDEDIEHVKESMSPSLFCANYELRHIADEDLIFPEPEMGAGMETVYNGIAHVDSAFYGEDFTAFTVMAFHDGKYYVFGKLWRKHVEECYADIKSFYDEFKCGKLYNELNADKGMVAKEMRSKGMKVITYHESMNKYIKIVTYLKVIWKDVIFVDGTDPEYIAQICDYTEHADHDDAPDSAACLARILYKPARAEEYKPLWNKRMPS